MEGWLYWCLGFEFMIVATVAAIGFGVLAHSLAKWRIKSSEKKDAKVWNVTAAVGVLSFFLIFGGLCRWSARDPWIPRSEPAAEDLVGVWELTAWTQQTLKKEGGYHISTHSLHIHRNGTFEMNNMPDWGSFSFSEPGGEYLTGFGTWRVEKSERHWYLQLDFVALGGQTTEKHLRAEIRNRKPPYRLIADAGWKMTLEQREGVQEKLGTSIYYP